MKILSFAALAFFLLGTTAFSQTKKIAFKSHSGNMTNFHITLDNELFDNGESDYGLPGSKSKYKVDSVIYLSDSSSLLVSKQYDAPFEAKSDSQYKFIGVRKDTVYNSSLFSRKNSADSIRNGIKALGGMITEYEASNKTVIIGFGKTKSRPKEKVQQQQQEFLPPVIPQNPPNNNSPFDPTLLLMLGSILLLSLAGGWATWKFYRPAFQ